MQLAEEKFNMRQCSACHCPNTEQYSTKNSSWHRGKNPLVWQQQVIPFHPRASHALPPQVAEHKHHQTYCYPLLQQMKWQNPLVGLTAPNFSRNMQEMKEVISWGFGLGSFLGLFWAVFLWWWWFVGCFLVDFLRWYLWTCLPSRSPLVSCSSAGLAFGIDFCSTGSIGKLPKAF